MSLPKPENVPELPGPYEILELADGQTVTLHPERFDLGWMPITPTDGRPGKKIIALRLHVRRADKPIGPSFYDVTAQHLVNDLLPIVEPPRLPGYAVRITKHGFAPRARFTVEVIPA